MRLVFTLGCVLALSACAQATQRPLLLADETPTRKELELQRDVLQSQRALMDRTAAFADLLKENTTLWQEKLQAQQRDIDEQLRKRDAAQGGGAATADH